MADTNVRLTQFEIRGLFDQFNYLIPLRLDEHITAIIAPNGTGKTLCLRLIEAFFGRRWSVFTDIQFERVIYTFSEGSTVLVRKKPAKDGKRELTISIKPPKVKAIAWEPSLLSTRQLVHIERYLPFITRVAPDRWRHDGSGELFTATEIVETFSDHLPAELTKSVYSEPPQELVTLIKAIDCRLIETQRLLILNDQTTEGWRSTGRKQSSTLAITRKAEKLKEIISTEINRYAALSQTLDRSFPRRVINRAQEESPEGLTDRLDDLDRKRKELMAAGILNTESDEPVQLPEGPLTKEIASVLQVYAEDNAQKLGSLSPLLAKITLFKALIDKRFLTKEIVVNRQIGFGVFADETREVPLEKLSSGEQHQLVLFFEMLFEIRSNSLILIDEPELSLHVAWQRQFIGDLIKIIELNRFDVMLATHSPQLIGEWDDLVVELGDVDPDYNHYSDEFNADSVGIEVEY